MIRSTLAVAASAVLVTLSMWGAAGPAHADSAAPTAKVEIVLDASGSMAQPAGDGRSKIEAARAALTHVVDGLPAGAHTGMRVFGATQPPGRDTPASCRDSQLVVPIGTDNAAQLRAAIDRYKPHGQTPTAYALTQAAKDLGSSGPRTIILVSDGEATCHPNPCVTAEKLAAQGIDLHIDVVGFKVKDAARKQLQCVADSGRGTYFDAGDTSSLTSALTAAQAAAAAPFDPQGTRVTGTPTTAGAPTLTAGSYVDSVPTSDTTKRYYRLHHTIPGSTFWIGVTTQMAHGDFSTLNATIDTTDGARCNRDYAVHDQLASIVVTNVNPAQAGCSPKHDQYLTITGKPDKVVKGQRMQITVAEEPPAHGPHTGPTAAPTSTTRWTPMAPPATPKAIPAVPSLTAAPEVTAGTYGLQLAPHSVALVKVYLDWGQRLQVIGSVPPVHMWSPDTAIDLDLLSPIGGSVTDALAQKLPPTLPFAGSGNSSQVPVTMHPVEYANRNAGLAWVNGTARPGDFYIAVSRRGIADNQDSTVLPVHLQVAVIGTAGAGAPTYEAAAATTSPAPVATASSGSATVAAAASAGNASSGRNWPLIGGLAGGVLVLAAAGGVAANALRRKD